MAMCLVLGVNFGAFATVMQLSLSSQTVHLKTGFLAKMPNVSEISCSKPMNGITSLIAVLRAMYSLSVVLRAISVWSLLPQEMGHPANVIMNPVLESTDSGDS